MLVATGVEPLIPIYQRGILYGSPAIREVSAAGLGELIDYTATAFLAGPLMVKMTGPLLRIVGDRNPPAVKIAILKTLQRILQKGGAALRAFVPQFQTTFVKALSDPSRQVRVEAIAALSMLMPLSTRVDPLLKELVAGALGKSSTVAAAEGVAASTAIQTATLEALAAVLEQGGSKVKSTESVESALEAARQLLSNPDEGIREGAAKVMGRSCALLGIDVTTKELQSLMDDASSESTRRHGRACAMQRILECTVELKMNPALMDQLRSVSISFVKDDKSQVQEAGYAALGATMGRSATPKSTWRACEADWLSVLRDTRETIEIHRAVARGLCIALSMLDPTIRIQVMGINLLDACLAMALKSSQRVQLAFYDVLYLALNVSEEGGDTGGLNRYCELAVFDNQKSMKSLHTKVLSKIKGISILDR
jgi:HEAT repeat protein